MKNVFNSKNDKKRVLFIEKRERERTTTLNGNSELKTWMKL